jgi:hypothetical protein
LWAAQETMENLRPSVGAENTSQKKFRSDKIIEVVNDSDSGVGNFSEFLTVTRAK